MFAQLWLVRDYLPEIAELDRRTFPSLAQLAAWLGKDTTIETIPVPADTPDWMLGSFWAHPERVLDETARTATSGFARMAPEVVQRAVDAVSQDLDTGAWDGRHGALRHLEEYDAGLRLLVAG